MYSPSSRVRSKKKPLGREQASSLSPRPNYDKEVDEVVEQNTRTTVTPEGIAQITQELTNDLLEDLRKQTQIQLYPIIGSKEGDGFL